MTSNSKKIHYRSLIAPEDHCPHFLAALQVIAHVLAPLRKALIHFYLLSKKKTLEKEEWQTLQALGQLCQALIASPNNVGSINERSENSEEDEEQVPVDPTFFYNILEPCLKKLKKTTQPKDSTQALQILLETTQQCCRTIPVTSHLWSALLDQAGAGLIAKQIIVGKCTLEDDGEILQRTKKESIMLWCPWVLPSTESGDLKEALEEYCARQTHEYNFDERSFDFEVRIPLWDKKKSDEEDTSKWVTTKALQFSSLTSYLFLGIPRFDDEGKKKGPNEWKIPKCLDLTNLCVPKDVKGSTEYELVGGILHDGEEDYVAILKNPSVKDPEDERAWKLLESEEVIGMTESDVFDFLQGEEEGPCGTVVVYRRCHEESHKEMNNVLSDIIISHVGGTLEANAEVYYEEEIIED